MSASAIAREGGAGGATNLAGFVPDEDAVHQFGLLNFGGEGVRLLLVLWVVEGSG